MTLQEFKALHEGKYLEVAGSADAKNQCTDLANGYIRDVWKLPIIEWTNAVDFPERIKSPLKFIANTPDGVPPTGSVIVYKKYSGLYFDPGHIAVVLDANKTKTTVFEQNYPTGSVCKVGVHDYRGCRGWIVNESPENEALEEVYLSKALQHFNVKTEDELISMVDREFSFLKDARQRVTQLEESLAASQEANKTQKEEYFTSLSQLEKKHALALSEAKENQGAACTAKISEIEAAHAKKLSEMEPKAVEKARENPGNGWRSVLSTLIRTLLEMIERKV